MAQSPEIPHSAIVELLASAGIAIDPDSIRSVEFVTDEPVPGLESLRIDGTDALDTIRDYCEKDVEIERDLYNMFREDEDEDFDDFEDEDFIPPTIIDGDVIQGDQVNINIENLTINVTAE